MAKVVEYTTAQLVSLEAVDTDNLGIGNIVIEYCDKTKTEVDNQNEEGFRPYGIVGNDLDLKPIIEAFEAMAGSPSHMMGKALTSKKVEFDVTFMAPRPRAKALANGNTTFTVNDLDTPIASTVNLTTSPAFAPNHRSIRVDSVTGFAVGQRVSLLTGDADFGTEEEILTISAIDATAKIIYFKGAYYQFPEDGAAIKVVGDISYDEGNTVIPTEKIRIKKYNNGNQTVSLINIEQASVEATNRKLGVKNPSEVTLKFSIIPAVTVTVNADASPTVEFKHYTEKEKS